MSDIPGDSKAIFLDALDCQGSDELLRFLDESCGSDAILRTRVEELIRAHRDAGAFLGGSEKQVDTFDQPSTESPGTIIGPYKLLQQIGEGGMGSVWVAEQSEPVQRRVALKLIKAGMDSAQVLRRFEAERQALALMDHQHIAKVLDAGATPQGRPYFAMELIKGIPITKYCDQEHLTPRERLELFIPICQAVQHAHQKGVIHRDLKPSNVLIALYDGKPVPKVIDFGVAKATSQKLTERTMFTEVGQIVGTLEYMAPEQAELNNLDIDTRADIYSLGVILYELLAGSPPFTAQQLRGAAFTEMLRMIREVEPPKPSTRLSSSHELPAIAANRKLEPNRLTRAVHGDLDWIVMKALEKDRGRRYETANSFAIDIQHYLADEPVLAGPPGAGYRLRKFVRRYRRAVLAASFILLALIGGIVGTTWGLIRATEARTEARQSERAKSEQLWEALLAQARANRLIRGPGQRFETLDTLRKATDLARSLNLPAEKFRDLRNAVIATLALPDLYPIGPWHPWPNSAYMVDFDEAHTVYARTDRKGNCSVCRITDETELHHLPGLGGRAALCFDRSGRFLAVAHYGPEPGLSGVAVELWDLGAESGGPHPTTADGRPTPSARKLLSEQDARYAAFHRDGRQVALAYNDGAIRRFELPDGQPLGPTLAPRTLTQELAIALHPSEPLVAVCSYFSATVQIRDLNTGEVVASLPQPRGTNRVAWHPDGRTLAIAPEGWQIRLVDLTTRETYRTLTASDACAELAFNYAGDRLVTSGWGGAVELFDVGTGHRLFQSPSGGGLIRRFSTDDRRLACSFQDGKFGVWQVGDSREYRTLVHQAAPDTTRFCAASVHSQGRLLACGTYEGFGLWDLASGSELAFVPMSKEPNTHRVRFEPSGDLLTCGISGLLRWPIRDLKAFDPKSGANLPDNMTIGPPERLLPRANCIDQSVDGRVIVACNRAVGAWEPFAGGWVLHADRLDRPIRLDAGEDIAHIAVSPDGRWVATATHTAGLVKVWDASDGRFICQLGEWGSGSPRFSPDGKWLATGLDGGQYFAVPTWEPGPRLLTHAFAPDGQLGVVTTPAGLIRLFHLATGQELATLEAPDRTEVIPTPVFTPDGATIIAPNYGKGPGIRVWDLRLIRRRLAEMGLDWDAPPYSPASAPAHLSRRLTVKVLLGQSADVTADRQQKNASDKKKD